MLTKEHIRFKRRAGRVLPQFLSPSEKQLLLPLTTHLLESAAEAADEHLSRGEFVELCEDFELSHPAAEGLRKLASDRLVFDDDLASIGEERWRLLLLARQTMKQFSGDDVPDIARYQELIAQQSGRAFDDIGLSLYADLPESQPIIRFRPLKPDALLERYNIAQVQGLLIRSRTCSITIDEASPLLIRNLLRAAKFHRLLLDKIEIETKTTRKSAKQATTTFCFDVSGPLSLFEVSAAYGIRLAKFFPHLVSLPKWRLEAEIQDTGNRLGGSLQLKLDQDSGLVGEGRTGHIPEEFAAVFDEIRQKMPDMEILESEPILLDGGTWMCPDLSLREKATGKTVHVELFHRWHKAQLEQRIRHVGETLSDGSRLILGICRSAPLENKERFQKHEVFFFRDFPTAKQVRDAFSQRLAITADQMLPSELLEPQ